MRANPFFHLRTRRTATRKAKHRCCGSGTCPRSGAFHPGSQRRNGSNRLNGRNGGSRRHRWHRRLNTLRLLSGFWNRLIPGGQLLTLARPFLFDFFKIVERWTRGFRLLNNWLRFHYRRLFNHRLLERGRLLEARLLLIDRLRLRLRLINRFLLPVLLRGEFLRLRRGGLRIHRFRRLRCVIFRLRILLCNRLLPWFIRLLHRRLSIFG